ncbi:lytic transglycosylase domain-containing protein [Paludibaculum fermentans]|uniref:lytic transglycosylase domain-containing protein n=1 Tax=Paludibaculum fermentans TaxID=1473598 RepID=UPI003EB8738F
MNVNRNVLAAVADILDVRRLLATCAFVCLAAVPGCAQSAQEAAIARQRAAIEKQKDALSGTSGALTNQRTSVEKQKASVAKQPAGKWEPTTAPSPDSSPVASTDCAPMEESQLGPIVTKAAEQNSIMPALLRAVISQESGYKPCAVSSAGAQGLMQLMPDTAAGLNVGNPFDPQENVFAGSKFLRVLLDKYKGDVPMALGAYNAGPARVDAAGGIPPIRETQNYVNSIMRKIQ